MELSSLTNRDQIFMTSLDMMVEQDSLVRLIDVFLDYMDTLDLPFAQHNSHTGRPAFPNRVLIEFIFMVILIECVHLAN